MNQIISPAPAMVGSAQATARALRCLINELEHDGCEYPPEDAAQVAARLALDLGYLDLTPNEPPIEWDGKRPAVTLTEALQDLVNRIDDAIHGYPDWPAANDLLDIVEDAAGLPRSWATEPQVNRAAAAMPLLDRVDAAADAIAGELGFPCYARAYPNGTADDVARLWTLTRKIRRALRHAAA